MKRSLALTTVGLALAAMGTTLAAPAGAHAAKTAKRPVAGAWATNIPGLTYYALGTFKVTKGGRSVSHIKFTPNDGVLYCTPGHYSVIGSFKIRPGGLKGTKFHIGHKVGAAYQLNVAYKIGKKTQPEKTSLEIDFLSAKHAHIEFGSYGTTSCNMFWDQAPK